MNTTSFRRSHESRRCRPRPFSAPVRSARQETTRSDCAVRLLFDKCQDALVVAEVTKNLSMANDPACLFIDLGTPEVKATGLIRDSVVSCLVLVTVYQDAVDQVLGTLSSAMRQSLDDCLRNALDLA